MTDRFHVDLGELDDIVAEMRRFDSDAEQRCAEVDAKVTALHVSWTGVAADAQQAAHERWKRGAAEMRHALSDLHQVGRTAHGNYSAAIDANTAMWPA